MSSVGRKLLSSLIYKGDVKEFLELDLFADLFKESEANLFQFMMDHMAGYGVMPSVDTIEDKIGDVLVDASEPPAYYMDELEKRYLQSSVKRIVTEANNALMEQDPEKAFKLVLDQVSRLNMHRSRNQLVDFREASDLVYGEYMKTKAMEDNASLLFGWPTLDNMTGGLRGGDVCSVVGRPASGKTFQLLYVAHTHWMGGGMPLVLSMEMTNTLIAQRLAAMNTHIPLTHLLKGELSTKKAEQMMAELEKNEDKERPFWLVDGNLTATVDDLIMLCRQLKPTAVFIDGAYLLRHPNPKASKWDKLTENAEWIKQKLATELMLPVVCSYQFNREAAKKKKGKDGDKAGLEDIYGTDAIAQLSSVVLGLFEHESVETEKRRRIDVIKGRNGETGEFLINWDFVGMDFAEISTVKDKEGNLVESTEDMQFVE